MSRLSELYTRLDSLEWELNDLVLGDLDDMTRWDIVVDEICAIEDELERLFKEEIEESNVLF